MPTEHWLRGIRRRANTYAEQCHEKTRQESVFQSRSHWIVWCRRIGGIKLKIGVPILPVKPRGGSVIVREIKQLLLITYASLSHSANPVNRYVPRSTRSTILSLRELGIEMGTLMMKYKNIVNGSEQGRRSNLNIDVDERRRDRNTSITIIPTRVSRISCQEYL